MRNEMYIVCRNSNVKGVLNFYAVVRTEEYFLFQQKFRHSIYEFYKNGVPVRRMFDYKLAHDDRAIQNVIKRLPAQIAYAEKEHGICILNKTRQRFAA